MKKFIKVIIISFILFFIVIIASLQSYPIVQERNALSPQEVELAYKAAKNILKEITSSDEGANINVDKKSFNAFSQLLSHIVPQTTININLSRYGILLSSSTEITFLPTSPFFNLSCWVVEIKNGLGFENCVIGGYSLSGSSVNFLLNKILFATLGEEGQLAFNQLMTNSTYNSQSLTLNTSNMRALKEIIQQRIESVGKSTVSYTANSTEDNETIKLYLAQLDDIDSSDMYSYVKEVFSLARERSLLNDPIKENTAALWSLALKFGDYRFADIIGYWYPINRQQKIPKLRGRRDLSQHFIYSQVLQQLTNQKIGLSIGETKELLDSLSGGSGYSFSDLVADKAGLKFAKYITDNESNALKAQLMLSEITDESSFFPFVHDLPGGIKGKNFERVIGTINSPVYKELEAEVDRRVSDLQLFRKADYNKVNDDSYLWGGYEESDHDKQWLVVDTHLHSNFSDGKYPIKKIVEQAEGFGCDAVAITDHGDDNFTGVLSTEYFDEIDSVQKQHPNITLIPGFEWNIPPLNGREHLTVIFPKSLYSRSELSKFRDKFDHFKRFEVNLLSPNRAFKWLERYAQKYNEQPLLIYNHPSRKVYQHEENFHDLKHWSDYSDAIIGLSGAPGHQKLKGDKKGGYKYHQKAINGWDPSVAIVGGDWDQLLQKGKKIWGAGTNSDFHNIRNDYWPCEFSTTHLKSISSNQNDIIAALRAGNYWGQHGKFIEELNFSVATVNRDVQMGQSIPLVRGTPINIQLELTLAQKNWQGYETSLDDLELIIITDKEIKTVSFYQQLFNSSKRVNINYPYTLDSEFTIFRWRGKSIQPEKSDYMFYSNPIKIISR